MQEEKQKKEDEREELRLRMIKREQDAEEKIRQREQQALEERRGRERKDLRSEDADRDWRRNAPEEEGEKEIAASAYRPPGHSGGMRSGRNFEDNETPWRDRRGTREDNYGRGRRGGWQEREESNRRGGDWREDRPRTDDRGWRQKEDDNREGGDRGGTSWRGSGRYESDRGRYESDRSPRPVYDGDRRRGEDERAGGRWRREEERGGGLDRRRDWDRRDRGM